MPEVGRFRDREDAGERLSRVLEKFRETAPVVIGEARGGVVVAGVVARRLHAVLDLVVVRKLAHPSTPEYGLGAVAEDGSTIIDRSRAVESGVDPVGLEPVAVSVAAEARQTGEWYRAGRPVCPLQDRTVIVVDDGIATGGTARVAIRAVRARGATRVILAAPVGPPEAQRELAMEVHHMVVLETPARFQAGGSWYDAFPPVSDVEVLAVLGAPDRVTG